MRFIPDGIGAFALLFALSFAVPASAQVPDRISADDPDGLVAALKFAGYKAELTTDNWDDPKIDTEFAGYPGSILFYGCDEETHRECSAVQFYGGLDRQDPMPAELALEIAGEYRFLAISRDDEGDPWFAWDLFTGREGLDTSLFLASLREFERSYEAAADIVFEEERRLEDAEAGLRSRIDLLDTQQ